MKRSLILSAVLLTVLSACGLDSSVPSSLESSLPAQQVTTTVAVEVEVPPTEPTPTAATETVIVEGIVIPVKPETLTAVDVIAAENGILFGGDTPIVSVPPRPETVDIVMPDLPFDEAEQTVETETVTVVPIDQKPEHVEKPTTFVAPEDIVDTPPPLPDGEEFSTPPTN